MIIKQTRIPVGQGNNLRKYLMTAGENEAVEELSGDLNNIDFSDLISRGYGRTYGTRHVIISPQKRLDPDELGKVIEQTCDEFGVPESSRQRLAVVLHEKQRTDDNDGARFHYHVAIPEVDDLTGRVLSSSFFKMRNEKLSRMAELTLGHDVIPGRFNRQVYEALQADGVDVRRYEEALRDACKREGIPEKGWLDYSARASFSPDTQHAAERKTSADDRFRNPQQVREFIKTLGRDPARILSALEAEGFEISPGRKPGAWIVAKDGVPFGSLDRLAKLKREAVNDAATERFGSPEVWPSPGPHAPGSSRNAGHRARDKGASGRAGNRVGRPDTSGADDRPSGDAVGTRGRSRTHNEDRAGAGNHAERSTPRTDRSGEGPKPNPVWLDAHLRAASKVRPNAMAALRQRLDGQISQGKHRAEVMNTACNLVASANDGSADYIGIDVEGGFAAAAAFLSKWAAAQSRNMKP